MDAARPRHGRRRVEPRGPEPRAAELDEAAIAQREPRDLSERHRASGRAHHEGASILDPHVVGGALEQTRGDAARLDLHFGRRDGNRVPGVHRDPTGAGPVPVRHEGRVAAAYADVVERGAEVFRAHLGEHGLVSLARARYADEHLDVAALVDLDRRPFAGSHAAAGLEIARDPQADPSALRAQVRLPLAPAGVIEQIERAPELERVVAAVVAHGDAVPVHEPRAIGHLLRRDLVSRADLGGIEAEPGRQTIEQTLDDQDRLGPAGAAIRRARRLVGDYRETLRAERRHLVLRG